MSYVSSVKNIGLCCTERATSAVGRDGRGRGGATPHGGGSGWSKAAPLRHCAGPGYSPGRASQSTKRGSSQKRGGLLAIRVLAGNTSLL